MLHFNTIKMTAEEFEKGRRIHGSKYAKVILNGDEMTWAGTPAFPHHTRLPNSAVDYTIILMSVVFSLTENTLLKANSQAINTIQSTLLLETFTLIFILIITLIVLKLVLETAVFKEVRSVKEYLR